MHEELIRLLNIPRAMGIVELTRTSDGFWLGREDGNCGFNAFLGKPSFHDGPGRDAMRETWREWGWKERRAAVRQAKRFGLRVRVMLGRS